MGREIKIVYEFSNPYCNNWNTKNFTCQTLNWCELCMWYNEYKGVMTLKFLNFYVLNLAEPGKKYI